MAGVLEALTRALGGVVNDLAGFRFTRLLMPVTAGDTVFSVETTYGWPEPGVVVVDGQTYLYDTITPTGLIGISYIDSGAEIVGARRDHDVASQVLDFSRTFSDIEKLRANVLVNSAVGEELSVVGRNVSVERPPTLTNDDIFREVVKALAYTPKGTMFALEVALTAFFGPDSYVVWEDLVGFPNTVFLRLIGAQSLSNTPIGKTYLGVSNPLLYDDVNDQIILPETPVGAVQGAVLEDEVGEFEFDGSQLPSAYQEIRYDGDAGIAVWTFDAIGSAATEGVEVTADAVTDGGVIRFNFTGGPALRARYVHGARVQPESEAYLDNHLRFATLTNNSAEENWHIRISDGARQLRLGIKDGGGGNVDVGATTGAGAFISGSTSFPANEYATFAIHKLKNGTVHLIRNGVTFQTIDASAFDADANTSFSWGEPNVNEAPDVYVKAANFYAQTDTDYLNSRGTTADVLAVAPTTIDTNSGILIPADVGQPIRVFGGTTVNAEGGFNNGSYLVENVINADEASLVGATKQNSFVESVHPARLTAVADPTAFKYPDDQGKIMEVLGGGVNAGQFLITHIVDPITGYPIAGDIEETSDQVLCVGDPTGTSSATGQVSGTQPDRFTDTTYGGFVIGDVGRFIVVRAAGNPVNVGVFQITNWINGDTVEVNSVNIGQSFVTETNITWELRESTDWVTETGLDYRVMPNFVDESGLSWELSGTADVSGTTITLRQDPPFGFTFELILRVTYSMVLSAQILPDEETTNELVPDSDPVEYTYYPFYMPASALGAFEQFIDELTVAGVIPELLF